VKKLTLVILFIPFFSWGQSKLSDENFQKAIDECLLVSPKEGKCGKNEYGVMSNWDVSQVTDMSYAFYDKTNFNGDISKWDVSQVKNMQQMFGRASSFNQDISKWNVENVTNMILLFNSASSFNQDISSWNTKSLVYLNDMFKEAKSINKNLITKAIRSWNLKNVKDVALTNVKTINPNTSNNSLNNNILSEESLIKKKFDERILDPLEGIWQSVGNASFDEKIFIIKDKSTYDIFLVKKAKGTNSFITKGNFETSAVDEIITLNWIRKGNLNFDKIIGVIKNNLLIEFNINGNKYSLLKVYPKVNSNSKISKNGEWAGNGSGIIISKSGYIITNHHVIKDAEKIEVEFMLEDELQKFNAEVVQVDKTNDLAVLKIFDMKFDGIAEPPYNFKFRGSDVGTKVYAFGYPMALTVMGKEIKVTDGMISSKTGFDGNITTYQITAPIQGGNSGGPLFDEQANLIGINSSGIKKAENVAYSIKTSYVSNLLDVLPKSIEFPSSTKLKSLPLTEQIKEISKYVVLVKVK
jgi:surface protein